jgi:hypothetical protein
MSQCEQMWNDEVLAAKESNTIVMEIFVSVPPRAGSKCSYYLDVPYSSLYSREKIGLTSGQSRRSAQCFVRWVWKGLPIIINEHVNLPVGAASLYRPHAPFKATTCVRHEDRLMCLWRASHRVLEGIK